MFPILGHVSVNTSRTSYKETADVSLSFLFHTSTCHLIPGLPLSHSPILAKSASQNLCIRKRMVEWNLALHARTKIPVRSICALLCRQPTYMYTHLILFIHEVVSNIFGPNVKPVWTLLDWDGQLGIRIVSGSMHF